MIDTLQGLNKEQAEAVRTINGPMLILAGAGSGKTKVLTCRVAHLLQQGVRPYRILAITFTNKAAAEMRERVDKMAGPAAKDVWLFTFHAFCARVLRRDIDKLGQYNNNFAIYDTTDTKNLIKQILKEMNLDEKRFQPAGIIGRISNAKNELLGVKEFAAQAGDFYEEKVAQIYEAYEGKLRANNAVDFDDLLLLTLRLLQEVPEARQKYQDKFDYIMVDEYQDTNSDTLRPARTALAASASPGSHSGGRRLGRRYSAVADIPCGHRHFAKRSILFTVKETTLEAVL